MGRALVNFHFGGIVACVVVCQWCLELTGGVAAMAFGCSNVGVMWICCLDVNPAEDWGGAPGSGALCDNEVFPFCNGGRVCIS